MTRVRSSRFHPTSARRTSSGEKRSSLASANGSGCGCADAPGMSWGISCIALATTGLSASESVAAMRISTLFELSKPPKRLLRIVKPNMSGTPDTMSFCTKAWNSSSSVPFAGLMASQPPLPPGKDHRK